MRWSRATRWSPLLSRITLRNTSVRRHLATVLVHGFRLLSDDDEEEKSLATIEKALERRGHDVHKFSYQSKKKSVIEHADDLAESLISAFGGLDPHTSSVLDPKRMGIVTHSFGGVVARAALNSQRWTRFAGTEDWRSKIEIRCVMLAPPNRGSTLARVLQPSPSHEGLGSYFVSSAIEYFTKAVLGEKAGLELASLDQNQFEERFGLPPSYCKLMVIAGDIGHANPFLSTPNDGVVTVDETFLSCPHERLTLTAPHNLIANHPAAVRAAISYLSSEHVPGSVVSPSKWHNRS